MSGFERHPRLPRKAARALLLDDASTDSPTGVRQVISYRVRGPASTGVSAASHERYQAGSHVARTDRAAHAEATLSRHAVRTLVKRCTPDRSLQYQAMTATVIPIIRMLAVSVLLSSAIPRPSCPCLPDWTASTDGRGREEDADGRGDPLCPTVERPSDTRGAEDARQLHRF